MDSDEAFHIKTLFHQGSYAACHSTVASASSPPSTLLSLYAARSLLALSRPSDALSLLSSLPSDQPAVKAVSLLASVQASGAATPSLELTEEAEALADEIADDEGDGLDATLRVVICTILHLASQTPLAIFLLKQGVRCHSLEAVALLTYLYLSPTLQRPDLARALYSQAKAWADDAILLQICEAWIGCVTGSPASAGGAKEAGGYQAAFYVFDEVAQLPGGATNVVAVNGKAVSQAGMGHWEEAQGNVQEAVQLAAEDQTTLANQLSLAGHLPIPTPTDPAAKRLRSLNPAHPILASLDTHSALFDEAASKFVVTASA